MKSLFFTVILGFCFLATAFSQSSDLEAIEQTITAFAKAADHNDAVELEKHLDDHYRIIMNRLFGNEGVSILPKSIYLEKIKSKEFGGDNRELLIHSININGTTANAKVSFKGSKTTFVSLLTLVKNNEKKWLLVSDVPVVL